MINTVSTHALRDVWAQITVRSAFSVAVHSDPRRALIVRPPSSHRRYCFLFGNKCLRRCVERSIRPLPASVSFCCVTDLLILLTKQTRKCGLRCGTSFPSQRAWIGESQHALPGFSFAAYPDSYPTSRAVATVCISRAWGCVRCSPVFSRYDFIRNKQASRCVTNRCVIYCQVEHLLRRSSIFS